MTTDTEPSVPAASDHAATRNLLTQLRDRLHQGDHLAVAADYLAGRLSYDPSSWRQASLIGLAMHHHLEALGASGRSKIGFEASQIDNGLAVTVDWPSAEEINQVIVTAEVSDANGNVNVIMEPFSRAEESSGLTARLRGAALASQQTVVIRPLDDAVNVDVSVQAGHRLRFHATSLTPRISWSQAGEAAREQRSIAFRPSREPTRRQVDVYGDLQASNPTTALEIVTVEQILEEVRQRKRAALLYRWRWFVPIGVAFISLVALIRRAITPGWVRESLHESGQESVEEQARVTGGASGGGADQRRTRAKWLDRASHLVAPVLAVGIVFAVVFGLTQVVRLLPRTVSWMIDWLPFAISDPSLPGVGAAPGASRDISAIA